MEDIYNQYDQKEMSSLTSVDQDQISEWLDSHPDFLNSYIRRVQRQRRSSIFNDQSHLLLANLKSNEILNSRNPSIVTVSSNEYDLANEFATSFQNALNASSSSSYETKANSTNYARAESTASAAEKTQPETSYLSNRSLNKSMNNQKDKSNMLFKSNLNSSASHSEPNLQPSDLNPLSGISVQVPVSTKDISRAVRKNRYHAMQQQQQQHIFSLQQMQQFQLQLQLQQNVHAHHSDSEESNKKLKPTDQDLVPRKEFKQLSLYEKMYTLVKTLYRSLNLKTTCKKILNTVSLLLDADRCSLFLVVDDEDSVDKKCLVSVVFDAQSSSSLNTLEKKDSESKSNSTDAKSDETPADNEKGQIKIPFNYGIAGFVASTGKPLNISNAYKDERFNPAIDLKTGYKTKSILCLPILNENNECIAVAEAINKLSDNEDTQQADLGFTKEDEEIFGQFMPFIAIAIRNSNLYYESRKEAQTNKVLLELATIVFDESSTTLDNLVSRILFYSILLLECERCQVVLLNNNPNASMTRRQQNINAYFDRIYELHSSELTSEDAIATGIPIKPYNANFNNNSPEVHIINTVIQSGQILNIKNLNEDPKYSSFAEQTKTTSLLCIPVNNSANQVLALIFACNKSKASNLDFFSTPDINVAKAFALFCGIGIQNIMMYEKVVRAMNMQQVALDVLSYHTSANQDEVDRLVEEPVPEPLSLGLISFNFDENTLDDIGTLKGCISMFSDLGLIEKFNIPYEILCRFFLTVKKNYRPVAYHNWRHGFNVMSSMYQMFKIAKYLDVFNDLEVLSLLIACICHDLDHRGTTNNFQIKIQSPLAKLYTTSTMEHHHFNQCIIILHNNMNNILTNLSPSEHSEAIDIIEKAIIATDLSLHFQHIDKFLEKANSDNRSSFESQEEKDLLLNMLMTACDLSGGTKPWKCHQRLSNLVSKEFFNEGDLEKEKFKMEPVDSKNRNKSHEMPRMQIQFLQSVCIPLYRGLSLCNPVLEPLVIACEENTKEWQKMIEKPTENENGSHS